MEVVPDRIRQDFPQGLRFGESKMIVNLMGVWATTLISKGATFGPFEGEKKKLQVVEDDTYSWEIRGPKGRRLYCIDAADPTKGNWMRYVKSAHYYEEQNIIATQEKKSIYYKAMRDIPAGEELLCWFSTGYIPRVTQVKEDTSCQDESTDELHTKDSTKDPAPSGQDTPCDEETPDRNTSIPDTLTQGASSHHDTSIQDTPTKDTSIEEAEMFPLENGSLAIALGGFQISNVVSLASHESVIIDDSSDLTECQDHMPILEKMQAEVSYGSDITTPISVQVSPRSKGTTPSNSPPLISPIYSNVLEDRDVCYNRNKNNGGVDHAGNEGVMAVDKGLQDSAVSGSSSGCVQPEENNVGRLGDKKNDSNVAQLSVEPSVAPPSLKTTQELVSTVRPTGCMLHNPRDLKKKVDYVATTKDKKNVLKCLTCLNVYSNIDDIQKHFVNQAILPRRRKRFRRNCRKMVVSGNTSLNGDVDRVIDSDFNAMETNDVQSCPTDNGQSCPSDTGQPCETLKDTAPLKADTATNVQMQCDFCTRSLDNAVLLDDHVKAHLANVIPYQCKICQEEFPSLPGIHEHILSSHTPPELQPKPPVGTDGTDSSTNANPRLSSFKKKRKMKRKFPPTSIAVQQQPQTAQDTVTSSSNTSQEIKIKKKRNPNKIHPCSLCVKMFASKTNVYRHKRVVHKIFTMRMRRSKHSKSISCRQLRVADTSETSDDALSKVKVDLRPVTSSSSDVPLTEDTDVGKSSCISSPPTSPNTDLQSSKKVYMLGGRRVRPILPAPTSSLGVDYSVNTMRNDSISPILNTHGHQSQLVSQPHVARDNISEQHERHHSEMSTFKQPMMSSHLIPSNNPSKTFEFHTYTPPGVKRSVDVKGQPDLEVTRQGCRPMSRYLTQSERYQESNSRQFSVSSPQYNAYATAADRVDQMVSLVQNLPSNASLQQSLNAEYSTYVKPKRKKQPVSPTQFSNPVSNLGSSACKPKPYVPMSDCTKRRCQHLPEDIYDQHGAMNLATKKEYVDPNVNETALDLTVHKRKVNFAKTVPTSNLELHQIPVQSVPLDLSVKSTPKPYPPSSEDSAIGKTHHNSGHLSTQLLRALEVVNAHAAMQVKTRNVDLEKLNISHSHDSTEKLIPRQSKTAIVYEGKVYCDGSNPQDLYASTLPNYESTAWPKNQSQHLLLMSQPAIEKNDVKDVDFVRHVGDPAQEESVKTMMTIPSKSKTMKFDCNVCNVTFTSMKFMTAHVVEHANEWPYKCEFCVFLFKDPQELWRHRSDLHRVQKMYACTLCQRDFVYFCNLKKHQVDIHGVKQCVYKELDQGQLRPQNFTDPTKAVAFQSPDSTPEDQHSRLSFLAQEMSKPNTLKIGRLTIKGASPGVSPVKPNKSTRKQVPFNPQRHHPFARARQIGYLSMLADPKNQQTLSSTLVNRCTKCEKEFDVMADFHQHILECAVQGSQTTQTGTQEAKKSLVPVSDIRNTSAPSTWNETVVKNVTSVKNKQKALQQTGVSRLASSTPKRQRAKPGLKIYNPKKYSRREPAANMDDIHTCLGCGKKFYFINSLERHMRMCPNREKLKLNDVTQIKQTTKKTDKTLLNSQHQCPFCKHHYTYLKSLKKHVLVCQFRPADIVDPLKIIEENYQRQQEELLRIKSQSEEVIDVSNTKQRAQEIKQKINASKVDDKIHEMVETKQPKAIMKLKKKKKKKSKVKVHGKRTKRPMTLDYSKNADKIRSTECDASSSILSSFSLKLKRITEPSGIPVGSNNSEAGGLTNHEDTRWCLAPDKVNQSNNETPHRDDPMNEVPPQLKKYPIRERSASVSTRYEDLSQFNLGVRYLRGQRSRARGRARGTPFASSRGASFPMTARGRGSERRGSGRGRVRKRGGRGVRGKFSSSQTGHKSDDVSGTEASNSTTVSEEPHKIARAHLRGMGRARCRGGSRRARGMGRGRPRGKSTISTILQNNQADVGTPLLARDESAETEGLPQVSLDSSKKTTSEEKLDILDEIYGETESLPQVSSDSSKKTTGGDNQDILDKVYGVIRDKKDPENTEMDTVDGGKEDIYNATDSYDELGEDHGSPIPNSPAQLTDGQKHVATSMFPKPTTIDYTSNMDTMPLAGSDRKVSDCLEH